MKRKNERDVHVDDAAGLEYAEYLGHDLAGVPYVLQHADADNEVDAAALDHV